MSKNTKPMPIDGNEKDLIEARSIYCYLRNNHKNVKFLKKRMNKRFRRIMKQIDLTDYIERYDEDHENLNYE